MREKETDVFEKKSVFHDALGRLDLAASHIDMPPEID